MTKQPYKINCFSETGVRVVSDIIADSGSDYVVEGLAIVTNHVFTDLQTHVCIACISKLEPFEDLTSTDLHEFAKALEKRK